MSKKVTQFLDLEDLSLLCFFQYLSFRQRVTLFVDLRRCRIQPLLQYFISFVDITKEDNEWIEEYLLNVLIQRKIHGLRLKEQQIHLISNYFALGDIQTIELVTTYLNDELPINDCAALTQSLKKLILLYDDHARYRQIRTIEIQTGEYPYNRYICPIIGQNYTFHNLTDLSISLFNIHHIFDILARLPNLQILKMHLEHSYDRDEFDINIINPCQVLRDVKITGIIRNYHGLNKFFTAFGLTIEFLTLNLEIENAEHIIQFESNILNQIPLLTSFNFLLTWQLFSTQFTINELVGAEIFQNNKWKQFGPIVGWKKYKNRYFYGYSICNLPYKFGCFAIDNNKLDLVYTGNNQNSPIFEHVHTILLENMYPSWSTKIFNFIRNSFPNIRTLYFQSILDEMDAAMVDSDLQSCPKLFDDDLCNNTQIQLPTVTTICLAIEINQYNNATLKCLFNLLPNLKIIKTYHLKYVQEKNERLGFKYDQIVENKLNSLTIEPLNIPSNFHYLCVHKNIDSVSP